MAVEIRGTGSYIPEKIVENRELEQAGASMEELEYLTLGALRRAVTEGDVLNGSVMAGQIAGMIHEETDCRTLIRQLIEDAEKRMKVWR